MPHMSGFKEVLLLLFQGLGAELSLLRLLRNGRIRWLFSLSEQLLLVWAVINNWLPWYSF
ncbi:hypothetical protein AAV94_02130 [Lampropedia cohaerens]|uniref:Uncharacterized protein n=1 Tax=Lampropedia cohaerens TaxID=1610491 RepID=A0A0U1Q2K7_9BURK|nr:hypothetical protein AAV94_02130 [Lampropedia cohaerens]